METTIRAAQPIGDRVRARGNTNMRVSSREWIAAAAIALALTLLLQLPYALGYALARPGTEYSGLLVNLSDVTYLSGIDLGRQGEWLYRIRFTAEPHEPALLYTFYLALGQAARLLSLDAVTMWHLARAVMSFLMFLTVFGFIAYFVEPPTWRRTAYLLTLLGAGFDWAWLPWETADQLSAVPLDLRMPEAHLFFSALTFPHYSAAIALILIVFWCALRGLTEPTTRGKWVVFAVGGAVANLGVALVYPFLVFLTVGVLGAFYLVLVWRAKKIWWRAGVLLALVFLPTLPLLLYYQRVLATNEIIRLWNEQVVTLSPNPIHYVLAYAPYLLLAFWAARRAGPSGTERAPRRALLWIWVGLVAMLLYVPLNAQRRFVEGAQVPLAILATFGLFEVLLPRVTQAQWFQKLARRPGYSVAGLQRLIVVLLVGITALASVSVWLSAVLTNAILQPYPLFRPRGELAAMDWLRRHARADDVVFSTYTTGSFLPHRAGTLSYIGHFYETAHFVDKWRAVETFFDARTSDAERIRFLSTQRIAFIFYGRAERAAGDVDPTRAPFLKRVFGNEDAVIYEFRNH